MIIIDKLFFGDSIKEKKRNKILGKLCKRKNMFNLYVVIVRLNNNNLMEIVSNRELYRIDSMEDDVVVIGITKDKQEALALIEDIISNIFNLTGSVNKNRLIKELGIA
jgi:hypothetical protein